MLTTLVLPQMFAPLTDLVEQIDKTGLVGEDVKELLNILKNPAKLEDNSIEDEVMNEDRDIKKCCLMKKRLKN